MRRQPRIAVAVTAALSTVLIAAPALAEPGGQVQTDTLSQQVAILACASVTLHFWIRTTTTTTTTTAETGNVAYDKLTLTVGGSAVGTWSNLDAASSSRRGPTR